MPPPQEVLTMSFVLCYLLFSASFLLFFFFVMHNVLMYRLILKILLVPRETLWSNLRVRWLGPLKGRLQPSRAPAFAQY